MGKSSGGGGGGGKGKSVGGGGASETAARGLSAEQAALRSSLSSQLNAMPAAQKAATLNTLKDRMTKAISQAEQDLTTLEKSLTREAKKNTPAGLISQAIDDKAAITAKLKELKSNLSVLNSL